MKRNTKLILLAFISGIVGFLLHKPFMTLSISLLNIGNNHLTTLSTNELLYEHIIFSLSIGLIPILLLIKDRILLEDSFSLKKDLVSSAIILVSGLIVWQLRIFQLNQEIYEIASNPLSENAIINNTFLFSNLRFSLYLIFGFVIGGVVSGILTKQLKI